VVFPKGHVGTLSELWVEKKFGPKPLVVVPQLHGHVKGLPKVISMRGTRENV